MRSGDGMEVDMKGDRFMVGRWECVGALEWKVGRGGEGEYGIMCKSLRAMRECPR